MDKKKFNEKIGLIFTGVLLSVLFFISLGMAFHSESYIMLSVVFLVAFVVLTFEYHIVIIHKEKMSLREKLEVNLNHNLIMERVKK